MKHPWSPTRGYRGGAASNRTQVGDILLLTGPWKQLNLRAQSRFGSRRIRARALEPSSARDTRYQITPRSPLVFDRILGWQWTLGRATEPPPVICSHDVFRRGPGM